MEKIKQLSNNAISVLQKMIDNDFSHVNSVLICQDGNIVFENYYNGYNKNSLHKTGCIFKNFISAAVGIARAEGTISSLEQRIVDIFKNSIPDEMDKNFNKIKLRHALMKSTGLIWPGPQEAFIDSVEFALSLKVKEEPGTVFEYKPDPQLLVYALEELKRMDFIQYIDTYLFQTLDIMDFIWSKEDIQGLQMKTWDIAKLGILYSMKGVWNGSRIISRDYIEESTRFQIMGGFPEGKGYGYLWWVDNIEGVDYYYGAGFGGQKLCVIPKYNMVLVVTSLMDRPHPENNAIIRNLIHYMESEG